MKIRELKKKGMIVLLAGAMTIGTATAVFAAPQNMRGRETKEDGRNDERDMDRGGDRMEGEGRKLPDGEVPDFADGERPELPDKEAPDFADGERPKLPDGEASDFENGQGRGPEDGEEGRGMRPDDRMGGMESMLNTEAVSSAIDEIEDDDVRSSLFELLSAYSDALEAEKSYLDENGVPEPSDDEDAEPVEDDELMALREAVIEAKNALVEALDEAGIDREIYIDDKDPVKKPDEELKDRPENDGNEKMQNEAEMKPLATDAGADDNKTLEADDTASAKQNIFVRVARWFSKLFS